jgi:hypothetical protein
LAGLVSPHHHFLLRAIHLNQIDALEAAMATIDAARNGITSAAVIGLLQNASISPRR